MNRRSLPIMSLGVGLLLAGCAAKVPYDPFRVSREQFYPKLKVVAMAPMSAPRDLEDPDPATKKLVTLIESQLRAAGLVVIGPDETEVVWDSISSQMGGFFNPMTGEPDEVKAKTLRTQVYRELRAERSIDAMLFPAIVVVSAKLQSDHASWDGTSQGAGKGKFWKALLGVSHSGTIPALSLLVILSDTADTDLYVNAGGIELLAKVSANGIVPVPREELFLDEERLDKAVRLALDPLLGRTGTKYARDTGSSPKADGRLAVQKKP